MAGLDRSREDTDESEAASADTGRRLQQGYRADKLKLQKQATEAAVAQAAAAAKPAGNTVAIDDIADTNNKRSIPVMAIPRFNQLYGNFFKWMGRVPYPHEEPTREQLSVVEEILCQGISPSGFALFWEQAAADGQGYAWLRLASRS